MGDLTPFICMLLHRYVPATRELWLTQGWLIKEMECENRVRNAFRLVSLIGGWATLGIETLKTAVPEIIEVSLSLDIDPGFPREVMEAYEVAKAIGEDPGDAIGEVLRRFMAEDRMYEVINTIERLREMVSRLTSAINNAVNEAAK